GEKSDSWQVMHINTGEALVTFEPITAADSESRGNDEVIVGKGTVLVKITFAPQVSHDQREYIVKGLMDIR
ncbi:MAG: hypothetical protein IJD80_00275, partial [Oscillospiraceae bacterium]|nr:hypothetical protein [Oscillospiraceae bacterium]